MAPSFANPCFAVQMVGIVTERDYLRKIVHEGRTSHETAVEVLDHKPSLVNVTT